jgi:ATP-dependent Clp endopeptidase proteolytic subunit ClpP
VGSKRDHEELERQKLEAEIAHLQAEAERSHNESAKLGAEFAALSAETRRTELEVVEHELEVANADADPDRHRIYHLFGEINQAETTRCIETILRWSLRDPGQEMTIVFNSPGGSVLHGLALYDVIKQVQAAGHNVVTEARGRAASMGGILLQAGTERVVGYNTWMLIHEVSTAVSGKTSEIEDEVKFSKRLQDRLLTILAERSVMTKSQIRRRWTRKDWWLSAEECVDLGFADRVG